MPFKGPLPLSSNMNHDRRDGNGHRQPPDGDICRQPLHRMFRGHPCGHVDVSFAGGEGVCGTIDDQLVVHPLTVMVLLARSIDQ